MTLKEMIEKTTHFFAEKGFATSRLDAELLFSHALNLTRVELYLKYDYPLSDIEISTCRELVRRRGKGEPVAYILKTKGFYKNDFYVEPGVLIPRPETEHLVDAVLDWIGSDRSSKMNIIDLGSGSGCLGLSLLGELSEAKLVSVDCSEQAVEITNRNAKALSVEGRFKVLHKDAAQVSLEDLEFLGGSVDIVVSNPPYIEDGSEHVDSFVHQFEPHIALYAGEDGLDCIRSWSKVAGALLRAGGFWCFEIGSGQGQQSRKILEDSEMFSEVRVERDFAGHDRVVIGIMKG